MTTTYSTDDERPDADRHVCAFCSSTFDASERTTCPVCDAEVVLRGRR
jgi:rubrerythrin